MLKPKQDVLFTLILFSVAIEQWLSNMFIKSLALFWDTDTTIVFSLQNIHLHKYNFPTVLEDSYVPEAHLSMLDLAPFWKLKKKKKTYSQRALLVLFLCCMVANFTKRNQEIPDCHPSTHFPSVIYVKQKEVSNKFLKLVPKFQTNSDP